MSNEYVLEIHTVQVQGFKGMLEAIKELLNDCNIHFDQNGMKIKSIEGNHVVLVHVKYERANFDKYYCERALSIGINIGNVLKVLKNVSQNDTLQLFIKKNNLDELGIRIQNAEKGSIHEFYSRLMDIDDDDIEIPETKFSSVITMPSTDLHSMCKQYKEFAVHVDLKTVNDQVFFKFEGDETRGTSCLQNNENGLVVSTNGNSTNGNSTNGNSTNDQTTNNNDEVVQAKFLLKYLVMCTKAYSLSNTVEILLKNNYPMILKYSIADLGTLKYCIAPVAENNE